MGDKDFFLSPDDSMTMGDINYMRKPKRVRRTFPKTASNKGGFAVETEVSANEDRSGMYKGNNNQDISQNTVFNPTPSTQSQPGITGGSAVTQTESQPSAAASTPAPAPAPSPQERRKTDTSMDMFRNMAKNIRR
ncbi:MAG: hypothetical protein AAGE96_02555 [Cyanobacteria bacterium P01_G01_bin.19]